MKKEDIEMKFIGIDMGFGFCKVVSENGESTFPSVAGSYDEDLFRVTGIKNPEIDGETVTVDGQKLLVGESAVRHSGRIYSFRERNWIESLAYRALLSHALKLADISLVDREITIATGLPVRHYGRYKDRLADLVREVCTPMVRTGTRIDAKVTIQPLGSFFDCLMNDDAIIKDHELAEESVGIIDIGFFTSDFVTIQELEFVKKKLDSHEGGISSAYEQIARHIYDSYGIKKEVYELDRVVNDGFIKVFGEKKDVRPAISRCLKELASEVEAKARTLWGDGVDIDRVIVTGGGAVALKDYLNLYKHARVIPGPQIANARGYMKFFRMLYNAG